MGYHEGAFISEIPNIINEENVTIAPGQGKKVSILKFYVIKTCLENVKISHGSSVKIFDFHHSIFPRTEKLGESVLLG